MKHPRHALPTAQQLDLFPHWHPPAPDQSPLPAERTRLAEAWWAKHPKPRKAAVVSLPPPGPQEAGG